MLVKSSNVSKLSKGDLKLMHRPKKQKAIGNNSEIESCLTCDFEFDDSAEFTILDWWKRHSGQHPILSLIAKQILATSCFTVVVEQTFSAGGRILDETRSRMTPESDEAQACLDD